MTNAIRRWIEAGAPANRRHDSLLVADGVLGITRLVVNAHVEVLARRKRITCDACGCLCHPNEICPGCRSNAVTEARETAAAIMAPNGTSNTGTREPRVGASGATPTPPAPNTTSRSTTTKGG